MENYYTPLCPMAKTHKRGWSEHRARAIDCESRRRHRVDAARERIRRIAEKPADLKVARCRQTNKKGVTLVTPLKQEVGGPFTRGQLPTLIPTFRW